MTEPTYTHGRMVWRELMTTDVERARAFYGELFHWKIDAGMDMGPGGTYFLIKLGDRQIGGLMKAPDAMGGMSAWMSVVSVGDVDATTAAVAKHGGKVLHPATTIPGVGRYATVADADGAVLSLLKSESGDKPPAQPTGSEFCWETLNTTDTKRSIAFYGEVFGWKTMAGPAGEGSVFTVDGSREGQIADIQLAQGFPPCWLTYVVVEKLEHSRERAEKLGGKVMMPLIEVPTVGRIAVVADPTGGVLGLFQPQMG